nr:hypothetical protein [Sulfolobus islandicus]
MKWFRYKRMVITSILPIIIRIIIVGAQVSVTPTAPPTASNALTTVLGYLQWLGVVGGVGVGSLIAGIKIAMMHDMEGGKRDLMYSIIGGVIISLVATVLNLFI